MMRQWVAGQVIDKPFHDAHGNLLESIARRGNRPGVDEFSGGGHLYPDLGRLVMVCWYVNPKGLLMLLEGEEADLDALITRNDQQTVAVSAKEERVYRFSDFGLSKVDPVDAMKKLNDVFGLPKGTTLDAGLKPIYREGKGT